MRMTTKIIQTPQHRYLEVGFTLIELMVVVAIIGILAAIAIPQFSEYQKKANDRAAQSDARNIVTNAIASNGNGF